MHPHYAPIAESFKLLVGWFLQCLPGCVGAFSVSCEIYFICVVSGLNNVCVCAQNSFPLRINHGADFKDCNNGDLCCFFLRSCAVELIS